MFDLDLDRKSDAIVLIDRRRNASGLSKPSADFVYVCCVFAVPFNATSRLDGI